jgi:hypothetical protein
MNHPGSGWDINNITYNAISIGDWSVFRLIDDVLSPVNPGSRTKKKRLVEPVEADEPTLAEARRTRHAHGDGARIPGISVAVDSVDQRAAHSRRAWVGDGVRALNVPEVTLSDYSPTSVGNMKRVDSVVDWLQERGTRLDNKLATRTHHRTVLGAPATNTVIDNMQKGFWEAYRFLSRTGVFLLDEVLLNGIENGVDSGVNAFRSTPAEQIVE